MIMSQHNNGISIQVGLSGYSFRIYSGSSEPDCSGWMSSDRVFTTPEFRKRYDKVELSVFTPKAALVPAQFFRPEAARDMLADVVHIVLRIVGPTLLGQQLEVSYVDRVVTAIDTTETVVGSHQRRLNLGLGRVVRVGVDEGVGGLLQVGTRSQRHTAKGGSEQRHAGQQIFQCFHNSNQKLKLELGVNTEHNNLCVGVRNVTILGVVTNMVGTRPVEWLVQALQIVVAEAFAPQEKSEFPKTEETKPRLNHGSDGVFLDISMLLY